MAGNLKKVSIIGNLAADPEMRMMQDGTPVCTYRVLVNNRRRSNNAAGGGQDEPPTAFRITAWRRQAEVAHEYLKKGMSVFVDGELSTSEYTGNDGKARTTLEVLQDTMQILTPKGMTEGGAPSYGGQAQSGGGSYGGQQSSGGASYGNRQPAPAAEPGFEDEGDIPF